MQWHNGGVSAPRKPSDAEIRRRFSDASARSTMDTITLAHLTEFSSENALDDLAEDDRFEHLAAWLAVRQYYNETTFSTHDLVVGDGNDTGIDAIGIIVNNCLVTDVDQVDDLFDINKYIDATFIMVQSERSPHFDGAKIGTFGYGVKDFFGPGRLIKNDKVRQYYEISKAIYAKSSKFRHGNPNLYMYYITTGQWNNDLTLLARIATEEEDLLHKNQFRDVKFISLGASEIATRYRQAKNGIERTFNFDRKTAIPAVKGVREAWLGYIPAKTLISLFTDESGDVVRSVFYENVRDFLGHKGINKEIKDTLQSDERDRFVLMNNGVTIIARDIRRTSEDFTIYDFHIVNGCQTSYIAYENGEYLGDVQIPLKLIITQDSDVMEDIIRATNRQTEVKAHVFFAMQDFAKELEAYFLSVPTSQRLYYERRANQYDRDNIEKSRIIVHENLVRAVGAMFLGDAHITTKTFRQLKAKVGKEIFRKTDKHEPYYVAALALYTIDYLFDRAKKLDTRYKPARYQILLAARLLMDSNPLPHMNSKKMVERCKEMMEKLWNPTTAEDIFSDAAKIIDEVGGEWDRDSIRTERVTRAIFEKFGQFYGRRQPDLLQGV